MGPRRYRRGWLTITVSGSADVLLQWGRDVIVADGLILIRCGVSMQKASMGPRRYRRGWPIECSV